jgi:hypothetical protein
MKPLKFLLTLLFLICLSYSDQKSKDSVSVNDSSGSQGYRIDQPGTITFTVGVKIKGKVEKPQVMIFLPKEKTIYREIEFSKTYKEDLMTPLPFTPLNDY